MSLLFNYTVPINLSSPESKFLFNPFSVILNAMVKPNQTPKKSEEEEKEVDEEVDAALCMPIYRDNEDSCFTCLIDRIYLYF